MHSLRRAPAPSEASRGIASDCARPWMVQAMSELLRLVIGRVEAGAGFGLRFLVRASAKGIPT